MKPLKECCNGCGEPPCPPSKVLCKDCLDGLDDKMHSLVKPSKEFMAWMVGVCASRKRRRENGANTPNLCMRLSGYPRCPKGGRPDCPALKEMPGRERVNEG